MNGKKERSLKYEPTSKCPKIKEEYLEMLNIVKYS